MRIILVIFLSALVIAANLGCEDKTTAVSAHVTVIPDEGSDGAIKYRASCSNCHGVPHPTVHKAEEWPNVVDRMETHRIQHAYGSFSEQDKQVIISYLQQYAAQ